MPRKIVDSSCNQRTLWEIKVPNREPNREPASGVTCPSCGGEMTRGSVPCPDGKPWCIVNHQGLQCSKCSKFWN
jgi:hypothetical protein